MALSAIGWVSVVTGQARFAVKTGGEVTALLAHAAIHTCAVTITLACWKIKVGCLGKTLEFGFFFNNSYFVVLMSEMTLSVLYELKNQKLKSIPILYAKDPLNKMIL